MIAGRAGASEFSNPCRQAGVSLVVSLLMLIVVLLLGISAAQIALQGEKASRNDRDRQIALQAAEAALMDAEFDIQGSSAKESRSDLFSSDSAMSFPAVGCKSDGKFAGLCGSTDANGTPVWLSVDFMDESASAKTVAYGQFTGQSFQSGKGPLPVRRPRYIIELMQSTLQGTDAYQQTYFYRVTAIGFGMRDTTQVVLQTFYGKEANTK
jgi:type IV pilus assembly protein PilX